MIKEDTETDFLNQLTFEPLTKSNWNKFVSFLEKKGPVETAGACITGYREPTSGKGKQVF